MNRREFNAAALAAVLGPHLDRAVERLEPSEGVYAGLAAFEEWWGEIESAANDANIPWGDVDLDQFQRIALYAAICDWLKAQEPTHG